MLCHWGPLARHGRRPGLFPDGQCCVSSVLAPVGRVREVVLDGADPWSLARFWSGLLGGEPVEWYVGWVTLEPPPNGLRVSFQASTAHRAAGHPDGSIPPRVHVDILVEDLQAAHDRVIALGAQFVDAFVSPRPGPAGEPIPWRVYADPAGHSFCLVVR
jgi:Glyoxalase-like domain